MLIVVVIVTTIVLLQDCPSGFSLKDLSVAMDNDHKEWRQLLDDQDLFPVDRMRLRPVQILLNFRHKLKKATSPQLQGLSAYLEATAVFYDGMENLDESWQEREAALGDACKYFTALQNFCPENLNGYGKQAKNFNGLTDNLFFQLETTVTNTEKLNKIHESVYGTPFTRCAHLGTNVCELFFSIIRAKVPSFFFFYFQSLIKTSLLTGQIPEFVAICHCLRTCLVRICEATRL